MRTSSDFVQLFNEIGITNRLSTNGIVEAYTIHYNYPFKNLNFTGEYIVLYWNVWADRNNIYILFNSNHEYIGYCEPNKAQFMEETEPTFY